MSLSPYTEDNLVQQITAEYLERRLGWESVYTYNTETFGPDGTLGRAGEEEVVLTRCLRLALEKLNPDFRAVPKRYRTLIPEYVKDYVPLNRFAA